MKNIIRWMSTLGVLTVLIGGVALNQALAITEDFKLTPSDGSGYESFGRPVSTSGDVLVVGAHGDDDAGNLSGSAYVYRFDGTNWIEEAKLTASDAAEFDHFGDAVSVSGEVIVVGAWHDDDAGEYSGSAYVYRFDGTNWVEEAKLTASDAAASDCFGCSVSANGEVIVVGAVDDDDMGHDSGSAYVYRFDGTNWVEEAKLTASDGTESDLFGTSVSVNEKLIVVGAFNDDEWIGSAYVYRFDGASWVEEAKLTASDYFGNSVSVSGEVIAVGGFLEEEHTGSAYVYRFDGANWVEEAKLTASDGAQGDYFGDSVSVSGDTVIVGASRDNDNARISGSAYIYRFDGANWIEEAKLAASDAAEFDHFGCSVSVSGEVIAVGAVGNEAAYIFGNPWTVPQIIRGIIKDKKAPQKDAFSIKANALTGLSDALVDLDTKTVTVQVGPLELDIPGERFITLRNGAYAYYSHSADSKQIYFFYFNPKNSSASLNGARTNLDEITNPITVKIGIDSHCWQSTTEWREFSYPRGTTYRFPLHTPACGPTLYEITNLGTLGGTVSLGIDINRLGHVVGTSTDTHGEERPFLWINGIMYDVGKFDYNRDYLGVTAINDQGQILFNAYDIVGHRLSKAYLWNDNNQNHQPETNEVTDIAPESDGYIWGRGINNWGQITGQTKSAGRTHAYIWQDNHINDIGDFDAYGINNLGQVVGIDTSFPFEAVLWTDSNGNEQNDPYDITHIGTLGGLRSRARAINDEGQVVGWSETTGSSTHAILFQDLNTNGLSDAGELIDLDSNMTNSEANDINNSGIVVGYSWTGGLVSPETSSATLWDEGLIFDLNGLVTESSEWHLSDASAINENNQIVGSGIFDVDGDGIVDERRAFMLKPCEAKTYFYDHDGDGYGDPQESVLACTQPDGYIEAVGVVEHVINGGMEGDSNWHDWEDPLVNERTDVYVYKGSYARYLSADSPYDGIRSEMFHLKARKTYRATLWAYGDGNSPLRAVVFKDGRNRSQYKPHNRFPVPSREWTRYSWTFSPDTTGDYAFYVELAPRGVSGQFYIDDISVTNVVPTESDCNDNDSSIYPGAIEICNGLDDDCDGEIDEGLYCK